MCIINMVHFVSKIWPLVFLFLKILNHKQKGTICPLTLPSQQSHFSFLSASVYHLIRAMVNFANKIIRFRSLRLWPPKNIKKLNFFRKLFSENSTKLINLIFEPFPKPTLLLTLILRLISVSNWTGTELANWNWTWQYVQNALKHVKN